MNIAAVETYPLLYRLPEPYGDANGCKKYRTAFLVRIITESGIDGWGECTDWLPALQTGFRERIVPYLKGHSALNRSEMTQTVGKWHQRAAAAVSMALTDIAAKSARMHICELWGGRMRQEVPVYASLQSYTDMPDWRQRSIDRIGRALDDGFAMAKIKIGGRTFCEDKQHVVAVQSSFGDKLSLILDGNQSYDTASARKVEWDYMENPFTNLFPLQLANGAVSIPEGIGTGVEPDMELIRAHLWDGSSYER